MLSDLLAERASRCGDKIAYTYVQSASDVGRDITYAELYQESLALAAVLLTKVSPGARALLLYPAGMEFVIAFYACILAGVIAVPLYPPRSTKKFQRFEAILCDASPGLLLTVSGYLATVQRGLSELLNSQVVECIATDCLEHDSPEMGSGLATHGNPIAFLQYTSGSTGLPKGVMVSHENILHNSACIQDSFRLSENSCSVSWLPHFHDMGLIDGIVQPLFSGFRGVLLAPETFVKRPVTWLQLITRFGATHCGGPNSAYALCVQRIAATDLIGLDLSRWHSAYCGAEPIRPETLEAFAAYFSVCGFRSESFYPCYGMAEATLMISGGDVDRAPVVIAFDSTQLAKNKAIEAAEADHLITRLVGCGQTRLGTKVSIVNPDTLLPCQDGTIGEIWVMGPSISSGYWQQPHLSALAFQASTVGSQFTRYLRTGDLGFIRDGEIFVTGRSKDLIIMSGQNHYPQDIEFSVQSCSDALAKDRGVAFAMTRHGADHLVVVQELLRTKLATIQPTTILGRVREAISFYHGLSVSEIILVRPAGVPITSSGKVQRRLCRDRYLEKTLPIVAQWSMLDDV